MQSRMGTGLKASLANRPTARQPACPPAGVAQLVEHQPSKLRVAGSSPVARFARMDGRTGGLAVREIEKRRDRERTRHRPSVRQSARDAARVAQLVERILGKDEVRGSIPRASLLNAMGYWLWAIPYTDAAHSE